MDPDIPMAILSAGHDELIAPHHQSLMYKESASKDKKLFFDPDGIHMSIGSAIGLHQEEYDAWFQRGCWANREL
jgi:hypothetical protein